MYTHRKLSYIEIALQYSCVVGFLYVPKIDRNDSRGTHTTLRGKWIWIEIVFCSIYEIFREYRNKKRSAKATTVIQKIN